MAHICIILSHDSNQSEDLPSVGLYSEENTCNQPITSGQKQKKVDDKMTTELNKIYKPSECMKYMNVEVHPTLIKQWYAADIQREVSATGAKLDTAPDLFDSSLILWYRRVPQQLDSNNGQVALTPNKVRCDRALYIQTADDIEGFVHQHTLASHIGEIKDVVECELTLVIFGTKEYFKKTSRKTKNSKDKLMTDLDLEMAIADLLVTAKCDVVQANTPNELALHITQFTKAIAEEPHKKAKRSTDEQADFYMRGDNKKCIPVDKDGNGVSGVWQQMLAILPGSSLEISRAICAQYPTPREMYNATSNSLQSVSQLADIGVSRAAVPGARSRRVGPEFARRLHTLFTATDGNMLID